MAKKQKPAWLYLLAGLIVGLFVAFLLFLSQQKSADPVDLNTSIEQALAKKSSNDSTNQAEKKPELGFYDLLPELEVTISPDLEVNIGKKPEQPPKANQNTTQRPVTEQSKASAVYWQVGSFSQYSGADKQKATLILNNWPAKIQQAGLNDGRTVYRVFVGPFNDANSAQQAQTKLKQQGLKPVRHTVKS